MSGSRCQQISSADLTDYAAGALPDAEATAIEEHLFSCAECGARAAELDALVRALEPAARLAEVEGFVTDALLNRLSRDGVRVRTFALEPGAVVHCAVWEGDELMALRLSADFGSATEFTLSQRAAGAEVSRVTGHVAAAVHGEVIFATPAAMVRRLPAVELELVLTAHESGEERVAGRYTLVHEGSLRRELP